MVDVRQPVGQTLEQGVVTVSVGVGAHVAVGHGWYSVVRRRQSGMTQLGMGLQLSGAMVLVAVKQGSGQFSAAPSEAVLLCQPSTWGFTGPISPPLREGLPEQGRGSDRRKDDAVGADG